MGSACRRLPVRRRISTTGSAKKKLKNKLIYHFGTGTHHVVGDQAGDQQVRQRRVRDHGVEGGIRGLYRACRPTRRRSSKSYVAYFGDIYLTNPKLLPDFDVVTMFHLCEFFFPNTASKDYGGMTDAKLLDLFTAKTKTGGHILFYMGSMALHKALPIIQKWEKRGHVKRVGEFKTLLVFRKK